MRDGVLQTAMSRSPTMSTPGRFSPAQETAIDYLVTCGVTQGEAYRNGRNGLQAVEIVLEEDRRFKAHQLRHPEDGDRRMYLGKRIREEAAGRITAYWNTP